MPGDFEIESLLAKLDYFEIRTRILCKSWTNPIWDLVFAKTILVFNANITEDHNVLALPIKKAIKGGAKLVVIDPREVELTRSADIWIRPVPGTEPYVLAAVLRLVHEKLIAQSHPVSGIAGYKEFVESIQQGIRN